MICFSMYGSGASSPCLKAGASRRRDGEAISSSVTDIIFSAKNRKNCRNDKTTFFEKSIEKYKKPPQSRAAFVVFENIIFNMVGGAPVFEAHISDIWECTWMHADFLQ